MGSLTSHIADEIRDAGGIKAYEEKLRQERMKWTSTSTTEKIEEKTDDKITEAVIDDLRSRSKVGIKKYNTTLDQNNKDDYMNHLYQELLDAAQYIKKETSFVPMIKQLALDNSNDADLGAKIREMFLHGK
jgi:hypothetical protein